MTIKEAVAYLNLKRKELDQIAKRYWDIYELFSPEVVSVCFEISPEFSIDDIVRLNQEMISDNVTKIEDFKKAIIEQIKQFSSSSPDVLVGNVPKSQIDEAVESASIGASRLEEQTEPMKSYVFTRNMLYHRNDGDPSLGSNPKYLN